MNGGPKRQLKRPLKKGGIAPTSGVNRAVIYCRVSTKEQVENFSLPTQQKACRDYCAQHNFEVDKVFVEEGESAKTANRTQFQKALAYCRENKGRVKWFVVYALNRFARNSHDHLATRAVLAGWGVNLRSVIETLDESSQGKFMESIMAAVAQLDNDVRADRTVAGMKAAIEAGKWTFKAPPGYLNNGRNGSPSLIHDPERGPLVKQAFELYAASLQTKQKVLEIVTAAGLRTRRGKPISKQTFNAMLRKPVYAGWIQVDGWGERVRGDFEPLVSQEVFDTVQALLNGKRVSVTPRLRSHPDFPLRHFVKCGCCGRPLTASWQKGRSARYGYYWCPNSCRGVSVRKENLERSFVAFLERMQPKPQYVKLFNEIVLDVWKEKQAQILTLSISLKQRIEDLHGRTERLEEAFLYEKAIDRETYERQRDKLNEQIVLAEMQERDAKLEDYDVEAVLNFAEHVILNAARLWIEFSSDQKQRLQKVLFPEGVRFEDGVIKTAATCLLFKLLAEPEAGKTTLATLTGFEPVLPP
jgi:site-specific DNA recombinase